jgi:hypothetical protein
MVPDPYRSALERRSAAAFDGRTLSFPADAKLPKVCFGCAMLEVPCKERNLMIMPTWLAVFAVIMIGRAGIQFSRKRTVSVRYALCDPCARRALDVEQMLQGLAVANLVLGVGFLTALFNDAPFAAAAIAICGWTLLYVAYRRYVHDRRLFLTGGPPCLRLRGVHPVAAEAVVEALRLDEHDDAPGHAS